MDTRIMYPSHSKPMMSKEHVAIFVGFNSSVSESAISESECVPKSECIPKRLCAGDVVLLCSCLRPWHT